MSNNGGTFKRKAPDEASADSTHISFSIKGQDGRQLFFKVNREAQFAKVFREYCNRMNFDYGTLRFVYDGHRVNAKQTARKINLEDNDEILAFSDIMGGGVAALSLYHHVMAG